MSSQEQPENSICIKQSMHRKIRSYVLRQGRMTDAQHRAIDTLWPKFGVDYQQSRVDLAHLFGRQANTFVEIGFGDGGALIHYAKRHPENNYLGIEVHLPGVGRALQEIDTEQLLNVRVSSHDAVDVLHNMIDTESLAGVHIFFPDPWHKKKHNKRRIYQQAFLQHVLTLLKSGGVLHFATDWEEYANFALEELAKVPQLRNLAGVGQFSSPNERPQTKFERRGVRLGHAVYDIVAVKE